MPAPGVRRPWTSYDARGALESDHIGWQPDPEEQVEYIPLTDVQVADHFSKMRNSSMYGDHYTGNRLPDVHDISHDTDLMSYNKRGLTPETEFSKRQKMFDYYQDLARQLYHRKNQARNPIPEQPPIVRAGRAGAPWRHVRQCTGNLGQHIAFIDGVVKQDDTNRYPPYGFVIPEIHGSPTRHVRYRSAPPKPRTFDNIYRQHAKNGFKFWTEDRKQESHSRYGGFGSRHNALGLPGTALGGSAGRNMVF